MARSKLPPRRVIQKAASGRATAPAAARAAATLAPSEQPPTEIFTSPRGVRGEVLRLGPAPRDAPPRSAPPHVHVLLLPGNPGVVEYYRPLLRAVFQRLPADVKARATVHALGLPGHDLRQLNAAEFAIADHVAFARAYLEADALRPPLSCSRLVVVGHSYGSYLGMRLIDEMGADVVRRSAVVLLMPALYRMGECAGALARFLLRDYAWTTTSLAWGLSALVPPILRDAVVRLQGHCVSVADVSKAVVDGRRRGLYLNVCSLARDEVRSILEPGDLRAAKMVGKRALLVHADGDRWCPPAAQEKIREAFGAGLQMEWAGEGVSHAFVLSVEQTEAVARILAPWISEVVRSAGR